MEKKKWSQPKLLSLNNKETAAGTCAWPGREGQTARFLTGTGPGPTYELQYHTSRFSS